MAWHARGSKTAVVAFKRERDAILFGRTVEADYFANKVWPDFEKLVFTHKTLVDDLKLITPVSWSDEDSLKEFCAKHFFDMIVINHISNTFKINGDVLQLYVPEQFHAPYLEELFLRDSS